MYVQICRSQNFFLITMFFGYSHSRSPFTENNLAARSCNDPPHFKPRAKNKDFSQQKIFQK